jgi:two-component system, OmpR family, copper resistance phosphate regulon response regulator CusR
MRILIVEDEKKVAQFLRKGFSAEAFSVDLAGDGQEALRLIESQDYDAIVLDIMLPRVDGLQVLQRLRASGRSSSSWEFSLLDCFWPS